MSYDVQIGTVYQILNDMKEQSKLFKKFWGANNLTMKNCILRSDIGFIKLAVPIKKTPKTELWDNACVFLKMMVYNVI